MHVPEYPDEVGPLSFESELDKDGDLEIMWNNYYYDEVESGWLTKRQAVEVINILSQRFNLKGSDLTLGPEPESPTAVNVRWSGRP